MNIKATYTQGFGEEPITLLGQKTNHASQFFYDSLINYYSAQLLDTTLTTANINQLKTNKNIAVIASNAVRLQLNNWIGNYRASNNRIDTAQAISNALIDTAVYELNEKTVNNIYLNTIARNNFSLDSVQSYLIYSIAIQCPLTGGASVYMARSILSLINDSLWIDDDLVCNGFNQREEVENDFIYFENVNFKIFPNPSAGLFTLSWDQEGKYQVAVYDILGKQVYISEIGSIDQIEILNLAHLKSGIYHISITSNTQPVFNSSISVIK
jgi:hypothetical protein